MENALSATKEELQRVRKALLDIGSEWTGPTADKVLALYEQSLKGIKALAGQTTVQKDIRYGKAERNLLDVYSPPASLSFHGNRPVLVYFHGGGFFAGDKSWSEEVYSNIGYYFASHGIITILANYQLIPTCQYPAPADDVQLVREWVASNIASEEYGHGDPSRIVLIGQSAGGAHVATNLYAAGDPSRASTPTAAGNALTPPLAGVVYLSVPFYFDHTKVRRAQTLREYYGSDEVDQWDPRSPVGLFKNLKDDSQVLDAHNLPTFVVIGQLDSKEIVDANMMFFNAYREKSIPRGCLPELHVLHGHNHISNVISIGTEDDVQGQLLLEFIKRVTE